MTPALFRPLFRASRSRGLHWRTGCRARLRRPSDLKHHAASREGCGSGSSVGQRPPSTFFLTHHAAPDCGKGRAVFEPDCALHLWSVGQRALRTRERPAFRHPGSGGLPFKGYKGRERRGTTSPPFQQGWRQGGRVGGKGWQGVAAKVGSAGDRLGALGLACFRACPASLRPTAPGARFLKNLPVFRRQTRASFRSRAARACALLASLSLLCVS